MLRKLVATVIAAAAIGLGAPAVAQAQPHMCDNHGFGSGMIYKAACGSGSAARPRSGPTPRTLTAPTRWSAASTSTRSPATAAAAGTASRPPIRGDLNPQLNIEESP